MKRLPQNVDVIKSKVETFGALSVRTGSVPKKDYEQFNRKLQKIEDLLDLMNDEMMHFYNEKINTSNHNRYEQ